MEELRLEVSNGPHLAGEELLAHVAVGSSGQWLEIETQAMVTAVADLEEAYWVWAAHSDEEAGWSPAAGPRPCTSHRLTGPVELPLPPVLATGSYLLAVQWWRDNVRRDSDPRDGLGRARGLIEVVGPTAESGGPTAVPRLHLDPEVGRAGSGFDCWLTGIVHGSPVGMAGSAFLRRRVPGTWESVATLFSGREFGPSWQPPDRSWFSTDMIYHGRSHFELPDSLRPGRYSVSVDWSTEGLGPSWCGSATAEIEVGR